MSTKRRRSRIFLTSTCDKCGRDLYAIAGRWVDSTSDTAILGSNQVCDAVAGRGDSILHTVDGSPVVLPSQIDAWRADQ